MIRNVASNFAAAQLPAQDAPGDSPLLFAKLAPNEAINDRARQFVRTVANQVAPGQEAAVIRDAAAKLAKLDPKASQDIIEVVMKREFDRERARPRVWV